MRRGRASASSTCGRGSLVLAPVDLWGPGRDRPLFRNETGGLWPFGDDGRAVFATR